MYQEGAPEFVIDQGKYYPTATNYGYYCTGFVSPIEWEDHQNIFSADGPDVQYTGAQTETLPYAYYTPSYGYAQSLYNPYNPYIPAVMGDGPFIAAQQYYTVPTYQNPVSPIAYVPVVIQPDGISNSSTDSLLDTRALIANKPDGRGVKHNLASASAAFSRNSSKSAPYQTDSLTRVSNGQSKHSAIHGSIPDSSGPTSAHSHQGRIASGSIQPIGNIPVGKLASHRNQLKTDLLVGNVFSDYGLSAPRHGVLDKFRPKIHVGRVLNDAHGFPDTLGEQNRGP